MSRSIQGNEFSWPIAEDHVVGGQEDGVDGGGFLRALVPLQAFEIHADEFAVFDHESKGSVVDQDFDVFFFGILQLPRRGFEISARAARHHLDIFTAESTRRAAAIHRGIADADDQNIFADRIRVSECDGLQPVDPNVDAVGIVTAGQIQLFAARRAGADEDGVEIPGEQCLHALDGRVVADIDAHVKNLVDLVHQHRVRQAKSRDVGAHQPAGLGVFLEDHHFVAQRHQIVGDGERSRPRADQRDALAIFLGWESLGRRSEMSSRKSAATRFKRQIATGLPSRRPRRQAGSQGRSQVRPRIAGNTFDSRFSM